MYNVYLHVHVPLRVNICMQIQGLVIHVHVHGLVGLGGLYSQVVCTEQSALNLRKGAEMECLSTLRNGQTLHGSREREREKERERA